MHEHGTKKIRGQYERVILIGNPNVGKSAIFGLLTGKYATVSNYPGTTVEVSYGNMSLDGKRFLIVDTPGVNNLIPMSEDERVTRDILLTEKPVAIVQVSDAKNLKRTLMLTLQLGEMGVPLILNLNMEDEARDRGLTIDTKKLEEILGIRTITTIATQRKGINNLKEAIHGPRIPITNIGYDPIIESQIEVVTALLPEANISRRSIALMILSGDESLKDWLNTNMSAEEIKNLEEIKDSTQTRFSTPVSYLINEARIKTAEEIAKRVLKRSHPKGSNLAPFIGRMSMHPLWGIPILMLVLYGIYQFVGIFGAGTLVNLLEKAVFGKYLNPWAVKIVQALLPVTFLQELLTGEYGIITMAITYAIGIILPITTTFFIAFAILEDSGYLPRLAIMANRIFKIMGLNGKAVLPMVLGLGCDTMATMTTRILETKRERIIATFLLALAVPCSAQLGVILGMLAPISGKATLIWAGSVFATVLLAGFLASKVIPGDKAEFFLEIPPIRLPQTMNVIVKTIGRVEWYLKEAVPLFILGTLFLFFLNKLNILIYIERFASPIVVEFLGLPAKATESFILGFLRRDYGAAGLLALSEGGMLTPLQVVVSLVTITLFVPCLANFFMIIKERGMRVALLMAGIIFPFAFLVGGVLNFALRALEIQF
ncbi:MAG: ferrous iron transport protein B [Nitrospirae bacterium]|nr:ferrous iron transport protein B [Nitrospirota bacterium]